MDDTIIEILRAINKVRKLEERMNILEKKMETVAKKVEELSSSNDTSELASMLREALGASKPKKQEEEKTKEAVEYAARAAIIHFMKEPPKRR